MYVGNICTLSDYFLYSPQPTLGKTPSIMIDPNFDTGETQRGHHSLFRIKSGVSHISTELSPYQ